MIDVIGDNGFSLFILPLGNPEGGLVGYTSHTVSVRRGHLIHTYNARGLQIGLYAG